MKLFRPRPKPAVASEELHLLQWRQAWAQHLQSCTCCTPAGARCRDGEDICASYAIARDVQTYVQADERLNRRGDYY